MFILPPVQVVCIAQAVYHEARGQSEQGQRAVGHVILNRSVSLGLTPCRVIRQPGQFNFKIRKSYQGEDWDQAMKIARSLKIDPTKGSMYFHAITCNPGWKLLRTVRIGGHQFYK